MTARFQARGQRLSVLAVALLLVCQPGLGAPPSKVKLKGFMTARIDERTITILDDRIHLEDRTRVVSHDSAGDRAMTPADLAPGMLIEAEGVWRGKHQFAAEKISVDAGFFAKQIQETAYLQEEPEDATKIARGAPAGLKADGEWLVVDEKTKRDWPESPARVAAASTSGPAAAPSTDPPSTFAGLQVRYAGVRRDDGRIAAREVELKGPAPPDAYKMPHGIEVVRGKDPQTGIDVIEFRRGKKVDGRMKLFPVHDVQSYVSQLGDSLLPAGAKGTSKALEFRFFVVEDSSINAASLPDGTVIVNTGLLGAVDNEAELAFVLSHEIAHVLQAHYWREVHETRPKRIGLLLAGLAGGFFIGDLALFLADLGMASVVNGHQRGLENQADRLGLQNVIERGYDPREAPGLSRKIIERYGDRSTSKLWSDHDSSVMRGSFLTIQLQREYPAGHFDTARKDTEAFRAMREAMGPVKVE